MSQEQPRSGSVLLKILLSAVVERATSCEQSRARKGRGEQLCTGDASGNTVTTVQGWPAAGSLCLCIAPAARVSRVAPTRFLTTAQAGLIYRWLVALLFLPAISTHVIFSLLNPDSQCPAVPELGSQPPTHPALPVPLGFWLHILRPPPLEILSLGMKHTWQRSCYCWCVVLPWQSMCVKCSVPCVCLSMLNTMTGTQKSTVKGPVF